MIERITQSFMKDVRDYISGGGCGNLLQARWVDDRILDNEEPGSTEVGSYYEFVAFGSLPKSGKVQPLYKQSAIKANKGSTHGLGPKDMLKPYRLAHEKGTRLKPLLFKIGLEPYVDDTGRTWVNKRFTKGRHEGTIDLVCRVIKRIVLDDGTVLESGEIIVIDLKFSGLLGEKVSRKNRHGWQWSPEQKEYHGTQAKHYHYLTSLRFFFLVDSSTDEDVIEIFHTPITPQMIESHLAEGNFLMERFLFWVSAGMLVPRPGLKKCNACPLKNECADRQEVPIPKVIDLNF